jgi:HK97 family phage prohead protease
MPYWIAGNGMVADCVGWATVKETEGSLQTIGCHQFKQDAIAQAIAIVLDEGDITLFKGEIKSETDPKEMDDEDDDESDSLDLMRSKGDSMTKMETRVWNQKLELREDGDGMTFEGYAAVWDSPSEPLPFTEVIQRGAFAKTLRARNDIKLLWNHDKGEILGSSRAGTLTLIEDEVGLFARAVFPDTTRGRDTAELVRRGDVDSMSFGFSVPSGGDEWSQDGATRVLKSVRLHEISLVAWPAYGATAGTVSVRSFDGLVERAAVDAEVLTEAMQAFESGKDLTSEQADLIRSVLDQVSPKAEVANEPNNELLTIKRKQFEMLLKQIGF